MKSVIIGNISESDGSVVISMSGFLDYIYNDNNSYRGEKCEQSDREYRLGQTWGYGSAQPWS